jgi:hypothetical protein
MNHGERMIFPALAGRKRKKLNRLMNSAQLAGVVISAELSAELSG